MKLELKHLAAYLPYGLKMIPKKRKYKLEHWIWKGVSFHDGQPDVGYFEVINNSDIHPQQEKYMHFFTPILRPLSDINWDEMSDEFSLWGADFHGEKSIGGITRASLDDYEVLFKNHFDVSSLIENDLAIDINTIEL